MIKFLCTFIIRKQAKEYLEEFKKAKLAEADEGFYTYVGDKHYFEFERNKTRLKLNKITDIVYW
jgi:hypothetical protein